MNETTCATGTEPQGVPKGIPFNYRQAAREYLVYADKDTSECESGGPEQDFSLRAASIMAMLEIGKQLERIADALNAQGSRDLQAESARIYGGIPHE